MFVSETRLVVGSRRLERGSVRPSEKAPRLELSRRRAYLLMEKLEGYVRRVEDMSRVAAVF